MLLVLRMQTSPTGTDVPFQGSLIRSQIPKESVTSRVDRGGIRQPTLHNVEAACSGGEDEAANQVQTGRKDPGGGKCKPQELKIKGHK